MPNTGLKIDVSGFSFVFRHPAWPWESQLWLGPGAPLVANVRTGSVAG